MNENTIAAIINSLFFVVPLVLTGTGMLVYDCLQRRKTQPNGNYLCTKCGFVFPQNTAKISGFESSRYGLHINCPNCGRVVEQHLKPRK